MARGAVLDSCFLNLFGVASGAKEAISDVKSNIDEASKKLSAASISELVQTTFKTLGIGLESFVDDLNLKDPLQKKLDHTKVHVKVAPELDDFHKLEPEQRGRITKVSIHGGELFDPLGISDKNQLKLTGDNIRAYFDFVSRRIKAEQIAALQRFNEGISEIIKQTAISIFTGLGEAIGNSIGGGKGFFASLFSGMFASLGAGLKQLGVYFITASKLISGIKATLTKVPLLAIPLGIALVALGTVIEKNVPKFATGIRNFGGGAALVGERGPEVVTLPQGASVTPNGQIGGGLSQAIFIPEIRFRGSDLLLVLNRAQAQYGINS